MYIYVCTYIIIIIEHRSMCVYIYVCTYIIIIIEHRSMCVYIYVCTYIIIIIEHRSMCVYICMYIHHRTQEYVCIYMYVHTSSQLRMLRTCSHFCRELKLMCVVSKSDLKKEWFFKSDFETTHISQASAIKAFIDHY